MPTANRRQFVVGCSAAIANLAAARFTNLVFGAPAAVIEHDTLVVLFLRGGIDALSYVLPLGGADRGFYETARPNLKVPISGTTAALPLGSLSGADLGLHPAAAPLHELYQAGKVALIPAAGMNTASRSHFETQAQIELGTPGVPATTSGWLTRYLQTLADPPLATDIGSLAVASAIPTALLSSYASVVMTSRDDFLLNTGPSEWRVKQRAALRTVLEGGSGFLHTTSLAALDASLLVEQNVPSASGYVPENGAVYPTGGYGDALKLVAQMIKLDLGLRVATLDLGGWDTHNGQGTPVAGQYFWNKLVELAGGLKALYVDLTGSGPHPTSERVTVVVMSEFGRRLRENADVGTDHGHGCVITVLGGSVRGGLYGAWPGLANDQLYDHADLAVTTDFRAVLAEILARRLGNPNWATIFPGFAGYSPLGFIGSSVFADGFERGSVADWSAVR